VGYKSLAEDQESVGLPDQPVPVIASNPNARYLALHAGWLVGYRCRGTTT
jgi:hypothetical protein